MLDAAASPPVVLPPRYVLGAPIGRGAFGVVFEGRDVELERDVAIKLVLGSDPQELQRFETEARKGAAVSHPCLLHILDAGRAQGGEHFVVMERLVGATLAERIAEGRLLTSVEASRMLEDLLGALRAMEARRLVHRDIKPANVFLAELPGGDRVTKLIDFGLAKLLEADRLLTARGMIVGSPGYLAPERYRGDDASPETDLYALGATMFEALTGRPPFTGESPTVIMAQVISQPAPRIEGLRADVEPGLAHRVAELLDRDPGVRRRAATARGVATIQVVVGARPSVIPEADAPAGATLSEVDVTVDPLGASPATELPPALEAAISARYKLVRRIGAGGMGVVYEALERTLERPVAIKALRSSGSVTAEQIERFEREARTAARLGHPNIVSVSDFGQVPGVGAFLVMELLSGESLAQRIARKGPLPAADVKDIALQVLDALATAHRAEVVHRDLKPENIHLVTLANGTRLAKLLDFGVVKLRESPVSKRLTDRGMMIGTPNYMAPEQVRLEDVDARTDVYAMGATMYQALCGTVPYDRDGVVATIGAILAGPPPPLSARAPHLELRLVAIIERAMSRQPADRFADAGEMRDALLALDPRAGTTLGLSAPEPPPPADQARTRARRAPHDASLSAAATVAAPRRLLAPRAEVGSTPAPTRAPAGGAPATSTGANLALPMNSSRGLVAIIVIASSIAIGLFTWAALRNRAARSAAPPATSQPLAVPAPPPPSAPPQAPMPMPEVTPAAPSGSDPPAEPPAPREPRDRRAPRRGSEPTESSPPEIVPPQTSTDPPPTSRPRIPDGFIDPFAE